MSGNKHHLHDDNDHHGSYYVPDYSWWPVLAAIGLFLLGLGSVEYFGADSNGARFLFGGVIVLLLVVIGWLYAVVRESRAGLYDDQMHRTFWWGMGWFMFTDSMLFLSLLGALWYYRIFTLPELSGESARMLTHFLLWPDFQAHWPLLVNPDPSQFSGPKAGLELSWHCVVTTLVLLASGITLFWANWGLRQRSLRIFSSGLLVTGLLGLFFIILSADTLYRAVVHFGITPGSGIYGSAMMMVMAIFLLHIIVATGFAFLVFARSLLRHFASPREFSVRALTWFWYYLLLVWLGVFFSVY